MGRKNKRFIDKNRSETYQLIYRSAAEDDALPEERILAESQQIHGEAANGASSLGHNFFDYPFHTEDLTAAQKAEIKELGLPSDGYNYLKHLRTLGSGRSELPIPANSNQGGVFVESKAFCEPEPETRTIDARRLTVHSEAPDDEEAEAPMRSSTTRAFSHIIPEIKGAAARDVHDVEALMEEFEETHMEEEGDLLDSFIMDATKATDMETLATGVHPRSRDAWIAVPDDLSSDDDAEPASEGGDVRAKSIGRSRFSRGEMDACSSFSERWKGIDPSDFEGRKERTRPLEVVDETFEAVLEEYDEEEVGELDDEMDGGMSLKELSRCLHGHAEAPGDGFQPESARGSRTEHGGKGNRLPKNIGKYRRLRPQKRTAAISEKDPAVLEATKSLVSAKKIGSRREEWEDVLISVRSEKELDCVTAWTSRTHSTAHQPTVIASIKKKVDSKPISISDERVKLSSKSGIPVEPREPTGENVEEDSEDAVSQNPSVHCPSRVRGETSEDKRLRKQAVKAAQRNARIKKKEMKTLYRQETTRQQRHMAGMPTKNASVIEL